MVEVDGELFDVVSFSDPKAADAYRRVVDRWARKAGVKAKVWSQTNKVPGKAHSRLAARLDPAS